MSNELNEVIEGTLEELQSSLDRDDFFIVSTVALGLLGSGGKKAVVDEEVLMLLTTKRIRISHGVVGESKIIEIVED